ncbi:MAG TPA: efflux RND transporter periplasmic adaptor subunit [Steroidobacteraceae bacterium]|nr:efflux RND transporter periplasmic adaptor subunit [Steroidobacteraceae bacterium]
MANDDNTVSSSPPGDPTKSSDRTLPVQHATPWYRRRWIIVVAILLLGLFLLHHFTQSPPQPAGGRAQQGNPAITAAPARSGDMGIYVSALGTVTPTYTITVFSQITGRVIAVHYREGQMVRKGTPMIDIDPRPYQATLKQAQGTLQHDQGLLAQARMDLQRYQDAYARNAIAKQQLDDQAQTVVQYEGNVKADQGTVAYDEVQLEYCHIVAPIDGRVGLRLVDPGNTVFAGSGTTLIVITQLQPITVVFNVSEDDLPQVQAQLQGDTKLPVDVFDRADAHLIETGTLGSLDNQVDTTTGTVRFRGELPNKELALFPNQFVNARLLVRMLKNATLVPTVAIQHNGTSDFVYVVKPDNTVAVQYVTVLTTNEQDTAVQGLNAGVTIATAGFDRLENGAHVTVRRPAQRQAQRQAQGQPGTPSSMTSQ